MSSLEVQCAAAEAIAMNFDVPIYGLSGQDCRMTPGPLFWRQELPSYTESIRGHGAASLLAATEAPGLVASPGSDVTYMRVGGSHGAGKKTSTADCSSLPKRSSDVNLRYVCSQSEDAAILKGKDKQRKRGETHGCLPAAACKARFTAVLKNAKTRKEKCTICNEFITYVTNFRNLLFREYSYPTEQ